MTFTSLHIYTIHIYSVAFPKLENKLQESWNLWDFPGSPVTNTSLSNVGGLGLTLSQGAEIPLASLPKTKNVKQKKCCIIQQRLFLPRSPPQSLLNPYAFTHIPFVSQCFAPVCSPLTFLGIFLWSPPVLQWPAWFLPPSGLP